MGQRSEEEEVVEPALESLAMCRLQLARASHPVRAGALGGHSLGILLPESCQPQAPFHLGTGTVMDSCAS